MVRPNIRFVAAVALALVAGRSACADEGMWLLTNPPREQMKKYGFEPTAKWLEHAQKSAVRFQTGGSGSLVSSEGLVMTNHHVGSDMLAKLSTKERDLLATGFYARTRDQELKRPDLELNILWDISDVTDRVNGAVKAGSSASDANAARRGAISAIEKECEDKTGMKGEVVTLYRGGKYHLYAYKMFTDVRLVFAPEQQAAFFGGDTDNFEFPRYNLDVAFFRIYEDGKPLKSEHYLKWSRAGSREGDLSLIIGHPGSTSRLFTMDHLRFVRDVELPARLRALWRQEVQLQSFIGRSAENARIGTDDIHSVANSRKAFTGQLAGLLDPAVMARKAEDEKKLRDAVKANPEWNKQWGDAWDSLGAALKARRAWQERYSALDRGIRTDLFTTARHLVRMADELPKPSGERLKEYRDSAMESLKLGLYSPAPIYDSLEVFRIAAGLSYWAEIFGAEDPLVVTALAGKSPMDRATELVGGTSLKDVGARKKIAEGGRAAIDASKDPMIQFVKSIDYEARQLRKTFEDTYEAVEREAYAKIAAAKFAVQGESTYPDATFTLRLTYGPIRGLTEEGVKTPAYTDMGGMFTRYEERKGQSEFEMPESWLKNKGKLDLKTPFNFIACNDIIGGNSGSPAVNTQGEVIGIVFDGNIHSLPGAFIYDVSKNRAVVLDCRAIIEAMRKIYDAGNLADEITGAR